MIAIDMRFDQKFISGLIGKCFEKYRSDSFDFTNSVTQIVGLCIEGKEYSLTNIQEVTDYFGTQEDVSVFRIKKVDEGTVQSAFRNTEMIETPIKDTIDEIRLVNENQKLFKTGELKYDVWLTRGIIFVVDGREISFEKDNVPFSEEIVISRGYNLIEKYSNEEDFLDGWEEEYTPECTRQVITIKEKG